MVHAEAQFRLVVVLLMVHELTRIIKTITKAMRRGALVSLLSAKFKKVKLSLLKNWN